ncbi:MAG: trigger factor [Clostridiales bacterium]|nr:trigger factor [Clostridiales bacterium]
MSKKRKVIEEVKIPWYRKVKKSTWIMTAIIVAMVLAAAGIIIYAHVDAYSKINYDKVVELGKYKELKGTLDVKEITKKEVQAEIDQRVKDAAETKTIKKGKVKDGDTIIIDYEGRIDGVKFDGGSAEKQKLEIGSGTMIPGFEKSLIGKKIGETCTINVTFPKDYQAENLAGKDAEFEVTIRSKKEKITYKYDNKFIRKTSKYYKKSSYEKAVKEELEKEARETAESELEETLWSKVLEKSKIKKYPKGLVKDEIEAVKIQYDRMAEQYGTSPAQMGITEEQYKAAAKESVKEKLILHAIAEKEGIKVTRKDKQDFYDEILENSDMTEEEFEKATEMSVKDWVKANHYETQPLRDKVLDFVRENGKIKEK